MNKVIAFDSPEPFDHAQVAMLMAEFAHSGYHFKKLANGKVGLLLPDGLQVDHATLSSAMQNALRRMSWKNEIADAAIAVTTANKALQVSIQQFEDRSQ